MPTTTDGGMDNTNYDLVHALSVRGAAAWHDRSYEQETVCENCVAVFDRLKIMDREAVGLLAGELANHVRANKFPIDLTD